MENSVLIKNIARNARYHASSAGTVADFGFCEAALRCRLEPFSKDDRVSIGPGSAPVCVNAVARAGVGGLLQRSGAWGH